jgi:hypothetical protein
LGLSGRLLCADADDCETDVLVDWRVTGAAASGPAVVGDMARTVDAFMEFLMIK